MTRCVASTPSFALALAASVLWAGCFEFGVPRQGAGGAGGVSGGGAGGVGGGGAGGVGGGGAGGVGGGGAGGVGGGGSGGSGGVAECVAPQEGACYDGPPETRGIGACADGLQICGADGLWGPC